MSALGIEKALDSNYALSKVDGEKRVTKNFKNSIIIKPSIVYSVDDKFTTKFMSLLSALPVMPLYYKGLTNFCPMHVSDLVDILFEIIIGKNQNLVLECVGPEVLTFREIIEKLLNSIDKKRLLFPLPLPLAKVSAKILQNLPKPLITEDQLKLLKYDNIKSNNYKTNNDLGLPAKKIFEDEINKYSYNWRTGGQYSLEKEVKK